MIAAFVLAAAQAMTFSADRIAADNVTHAATASGHVVAVSGPITIRGERMNRDVDGTMTFHDPVWATTCSNEVGHTHWNVEGEIVYRESDYVILRNMKLRFCEVPVLWLPYLYYPLESGCGFSWMAGYTDRWGAYLLTRYSYHLLGDPSHNESTWWLRGATRFDMRYEQGLAGGEDLRWNLGDFGKGNFDFYYAYDRDAESRLNDHWHNYAWGSQVDENRYSALFNHRWDATERDTVRLRASVFSDSYFREDFSRSSLFGWKDDFQAYENSGVFWEHVENDYAVGIETSGRLNDFYEMTGRLPELYLDLNPRPVFGLPLNYETANKFGYLTRDPAEYGNADRNNPLTYNPGVWAEYDAVRFDTYHRLTAPFRTFNDFLSVVPRVGYHGTLWSESGSTDTTGRQTASEEGALYRSILEGGMTFAARGEGWVDERWRHMIEPYFDVLGQEAWYSGSGDRPYVFDNIDASVMWEDQFAGRSRNLPYSYYGVTPGVRNAWDVLGERGNLRQVIDFDAYAAVQFGKTSYDEGEYKLAEVGKPNYGESACYVSPGARLRWTPAKDISLLARAEYDQDNNTIATADAGWRHTLSKTFKYDVTYALRDYRCWDYSSIPSYSGLPNSRVDEMDDVKFQYLRVSLEQQPLDWFAWGPFVSWDVREEELDRIGTWFDLLTDCLGFRFSVAYRNSYVRVDGYERDEDWSAGFYVYLRAFGSSNTDFSW